VFTAIAGKSQDTDSDSLVNYEYRYYMEKDSLRKNEILVEKFNYFLRHADYDAGALSTARRVQQFLIADKEVQAKFLWNASVVSYLNGDAAYSNFVLTRYQAQTFDSTIQCLLLHFLINKNDTLVARQGLARLTRHDTDFGGLGCFYAGAFYEKEHKSFRVISSALIPGSGTMMNGYFLKGLTSLVLTGSSAFAVVKMIESGLYLNAALWGTGLGLKFYIGNLRLTEKTFEWSEDKERKKINERCEQILGQLLLKYPLAVKK